MSIHDYLEYTNANRIKYWQKIPHEQSMFSRQVFIDKYFQGNSLVA